jgi:hypothetical protein
VDAAERCPCARDLETTDSNRPLESGHARRGPRCSPQRLHIALCGGACWVLRNPRVCSGRAKESSIPTSTRPQPVQTQPWLRSLSGTFGPAKALRILSTSKDHARQTLIQSAFMIRTGLLPVAISSDADYQSCCSQTSRSALLSHLRPHTSIHADSAAANA